jgi:hypothetical protein
MYAGELNGKQDVKASPHRQRRGGRYVAGPFADSSPQGADVDKLANLLELQERWEGNRVRQAYNAAVAKFK